ncbi:MAG: hypothetical protein ACRDPE_22675 [Solirubrobacterales bacterium]
MADHVRPRRLAVLQSSDERANERDPIRVLVRYGVPFSVLDGAFKFKAKVPTQEISLAVTEPSASLDPNGAIEEPLP